jgi:hypothetical protein
MEQKGIPALITFGFVTLISTLVFVALLVVFLVLFG